MKVFVYYNLHRKTWSIRAMEGPRKGLVVAHSDTVLLGDAKGKVSESGRLRVLQEGRKNVHAGIIGQLISLSRAPIPLDSCEITYNPYKYAGFVLKGLGDLWQGGDIVAMDRRKVYSSIERSIL